MNGAMCRDAPVPRSTWMCESGRLANLSNWEFEPILQVNHSQKNPLMAGFLMNGAPGEIRTPDRSVRSRVLYPAELQAAYFEGAILRIMIWFCQSILGFIQILSRCVRAHITEYFVGQGFRAIGYVVCIGRGSKQDNLIVYCSLFRGCRHRPLSCPSRHVRRYRTVDRES